MHRPPPHAAADELARLLRRLGALHTDDAARLGAPLADLPRLYLPEGEVLLGKEPPAPRDLLHRLALGRAYVCLRQHGLPPSAISVEARLPFLSPAAGLRHLAPDLLVGGSLFVELDRGSERRRQLRHRALLYREAFTEGVSGLVLLLTESPLARMVFRECLGDLLVATDLPPCLRLSLPCAGAPCPLVEAMRLLAELPPDGLGAGPAF